MAEGDDVRPSLRERRVPRLEDERLLRGAGRYVADIRPEGAAAMVVVRSPIAHGALRAIDPAVAMECEGVSHVLTAADIAQFGAGEMPVGWLHPGQLNVANPLLATDRVFYVGQPVAIVIADDQYLAEDAAELVNLKIDELAAVTNVNEALSDAAPVLHEEWGGNVFAEFVSGGGDPDARFQEATTVVGARLVTNRHGAVPLEGRGAVASFDSTTGVTTSWLSARRLIIGAR